MEEILNQLVEQNFDAMVASLREVIAIRSVQGEPEDGAPYGRKSRRALQYAMDLAKRLGFETVVNVDDRACYVEYGTGSRVVGVFAHLDVVPEGNGWTYPPFAAEIHDNVMYGRGTVDNKGPFIASLYGLYAIKESGLPLGDWRIRVVGGSNEEKGMDDIMHYVKVCGAPDLGFTPDGRFPMSFTERGINYYFLSCPFEETAAGPVRLVSLDGGGTLNMVPDLAEAVLECRDHAALETVLGALAAYRAKTGDDLAAESGTAKAPAERLRLVSTGIGAHTCTPFNGRNAVIQILMFLDTLGLRGSAGAFIRFFAEKIGLCTDGSPMGLERSDECGTLTFAVPVMHLREDGVDWVVNIRFPYTYKDEVTADLAAQLEPYGIRVDSITASPNFRYPMDSPLITKLRRTYEELTGLDSTPSHEGGTYAKYVPNTVPFGSIFPDGPDLCHRPDERIDLDEYLLDAKIYCNAMYELTK